MPIKDIQQYIESNRGRYPLELLCAELRKAGHVENEIQEALRALGIAPVASAPGGASVVTSWGKVCRFGAGLLSGGAVSYIVFLYFPFIERAFYTHTYRGGYGLWFAAVGVVLISAGVSVLIYFKLRRRFPYFARGILTGTLLAAAIVIAFAVFLSLFFWNFRNFGF